MIKLRLKKTNMYLSRTSWNDAFGNGFSVPGLTRDHNNVLRGQGRIRTTTTAHGVVWIRGHNTLHAFPGRCCCWCCCFNGNRWARWFPGRLHSRKPRVLNVFLRTIQRCTCFHGLKLDWASPSRLRLRPRPSVSVVFWLRVRVNPDPFVHWRIPQKTMKFMKIRPKLILNSQN